MRDKIINIVKQKPKQYSRIIKRDPALLEWVMQNTKIESDQFPAVVYSAITGEDGRCPNGSTKKFDRISTGFIGCGPASKCQCTRERISKSVTQAKHEISEFDQKKINKKRADTMLEKYGVEFNSQRKDIKHIWSRPKISGDAFEKLNDIDWLTEEYVTKKRSLVDIADELNVYYSTVGEYCRKYGFAIRRTSNYSVIENEIANYIRSLGVNVEQNTWEIIDKEIDIYIPSKKLGIEINGLYWHSYHPSSNKVENRMQHLSKTNAAIENGIDLIHFTDDEWVSKTDIVKGIIRSKLGLNQRVFARKCEIKEVSRKNERAFLRENHIQGYVPSVKAYGLYHNDDLLSIMTVGKSRFSSESDFELLRFCSKLGVTVVGGGSKLLKVALADFKSMISYCDRSRSNGRAYEKLGFTKINETGPGYFWTDGNSVISRYRSQKKQLAKWLESYDPHKSESMNMFDAGYRRYSDCGQIVFKIKK